MARQDRERYEREKKEYKGPWKIPSSKNPTAPKRPASAFLAFSNERRRDVSRDNPDMSSAEVSGLLSRMWKTAPDSVREKFRDEERQRREQYRKDLADWSEKHTPDMGNADKQQTSLPTSNYPAAAASNVLPPGPAVGVAMPSTATPAAPMHGVDATAAMSASAQNPIHKNAATGQTNAVGPTGLPMNLNYADILPLLYPGLAGLSQQLDPSQFQLQQQQQQQQLQQQQQQAGAFFGQFQNISTSTMQRPSAATASDFTSYATFASSASGQASASGAPQQYQQDTNAAANALESYFASLVQQAGGMMQPMAQQQQLPQQQLQQQMQLQQNLEGSKNPSFNEQAYSKTTAMMEQGGLPQDLSQFFQTQTQDRSGDNLRLNGGSPGAH